MTHKIIRWGETGAQAVPVDAKKNAGSTAGKPDAAEYINWLLSHVAAGANLDRDENVLLRMPLKNSLAIEQGVGSATFSRSTIGTYIDRYGVLQTAAIDVPRFEDEGYLAEGPSTNDALHSENFNDVYWDKKACSITPNDIAAPDGVAASADKLVEDGTDTTHYVNRLDAAAVAGTDASAENTISIFAKADERDQIRLYINGSGGDIYAQFDLSAGTVIAEVSEGTGSGASGIIKSLANGWYRCTVTGIPASGGGLIGTRTYLGLAGAVSYQGDGSSGLHAWGIQIEERAGATSYILTVGTAVTRTTELISVTYAENAPEKNASLTVIADITLLGLVGESQIVFQVTGETSKFLYAAINNTQSSVRFTNGGGTGGPILTPNQSIRIAGRLTTEPLASLWVDGVNVAESTPTPITGTGSAISIGDNFYGHITNFRIYDRALSDEEMAVA